MLRLGRLADAAEVPPALYLLTIRIFLRSPPASPVYEPMSYEFSGRIVFSRFIVIVDVYYTIDVYFLVSLVVLCCSNELDLLKSMIIISYLYF